MLYLWLTSLALLVMFAAEMGWMGMAVWACVLPFVAMALAPVLAENNKTSGGPDL